MPVVPLPWPSSFSLWPLFAALSLELLLDDAGFSGGGLTLGTCAGGGVLPSCARGLTLALSTSRFNILDPAARH